MFGNISLALKHTSAYEQQPSGQRAAERCGAAPSGSHHANRESQLNLCGTATAQLLTLPRELRLQLQRSNEERLQFSREECFLKEELFRVKYSLWPRSKNVTKSFPLPCVSRHSAPFFLRTHSSDYFQIDFPMRESLATLTEGFIKNDWISAVAKPETEPKPIPLVLFFLT